MQTQDKNSIESQRPLDEPRKPRAWLAGLSAFIVVLLVVGVSVYVFRAVGQRQGSQPPPPAGQWKQVQSGYLFMSMQGAPSNPAVLYACATPSTTASNINGMSVTILRSADFGDHWQNAGGNANLHTYCNIAINPASENDIFVTTMNTASQSSLVLKHSADGGQTWTTLTPAFTPPLHIPGTSTTLPWFVQQLRYDGHNLYGVQWTINGAPGIQSPPALANRLPRLATSTDGGQTWHIIDSQLTAKGLGVQSYTLDPAHPGTIYEIAGRPLLPIETGTILQPPTSDILPRSGINQQLFKSTDNGANWQSLLTNLLYNSRVQLASDNSQIVYVGGIRGPIPLAGQSSQPGQGTEYQPASPGTFDLRVSTDGGASWQQVATPPKDQFIQDWFVSADGNVFTSPIVSFNPPAGATVIVGTAIVGTAVPSRPATPLPARTVNGGLPEIQSTLPVIHPNIQRYDLASHTWSQVTTPPANGRLLEVTPASTHGGAILWYVSLQDAHYALYRYGV